MNIQYVLYCEDEAQRIFLTSTIPSIIRNLNPDIIIDVDLQFKHRPSTKPKFNKIFIDATRDAFRNFKTNLFVLCFDSDSPIEKDFERQRNEWKEILIKEIPIHKDKFILAVPVQAIEHWLLYISHIKNESSKLKKDLVEKIPKREIKIELYNSEKYISKTCEPIVSSLVNEISPAILTSLRSNSISFNRFYSDMEVFLKNHK